jgi:hypothetical protein
MFTKEALELLLLDSMKEKGETMRLLPGGNCANR